MAICTKINTAGTTLQNNLNARGVSCTYGKNSESKQTIKDMADLITSSNLKGSADSLISITANRPYLLSGETTDLTVRLVNGLGQPLANKSVSISDGSSLYSGITNSLGTFTLYDLTVSSNTTFTATYSSVTATCTVYPVLVKDYATSSSYTDLFNSMSMFTREASGTVGYYQNTGSSTYQAYTSQVSITDDVAIDFELVECTSCLIQVARYATGVSTEYAPKTFTSTGKVHIEIKETGTYIYFNGTLVQSYTDQTNMESVRFFFRIPSGNTADFKYRDLALYPL